jgi:hypothetical protein
VRRIDKSRVWQRTLQVGKVGLLVELGGVETECADDVVDGNGTVLNTLLGLLSRCVGTSVCGPWSECGHNLVKPIPTPQLTDLDGTLSDHGAVNLVRNTVDLLHVEGVRHELIARDDVLESASRVSLCDNTMPTPVSKP